MRPEAALIPACIGWTFFALLACGWWQYNTLVSWLVILLSQLPLLKVFGVGDHLIIAVTDLLKVNQSGGQKPPKTSNKALSRTPQKAAEKVTQKATQYSHLENPELNS